jgi:predicted Zn-dependent peptidase
MTKNKTFKTIRKDGKVFNLLTLPDTNFFKFEMINPYGSNIEKVVKSISGKNVYGISHFIEHLSFKSTKDYSTQELLKIGKSEGIYNARTSSQYIGYWFKTTAVNTDLAIRYVCNVALNDLTNITQEEFDTERDVVCNEAKRAYDDTQMMFYRDAAGALVGYERDDNTIGLPEVIETFTLQDAIDVKNIFLNSQEYVYNITYDNKCMSEDEVIAKIEQELSRYEVPKKTKFDISYDEYLKHLKHPRVGEFKIDNASEQAMTNITIDAIENSLVSGAAMYYLSSLAENTSLDDIIRQKNGLTYGVQFYMSQISYKPYTSFVCDVTVGNEEKLLQLFKESINTTTDEFSIEKYEDYMKTSQLTRVIDNLNLEAYEIWFYYNNLQPTALDPVRNLLAENVDEAFIAVERDIITYPKMKEAMESIKELVNTNKYGKVHN